MFEHCQGVVIVENGTAVDGVCVCGALTRPGCDVGSALVLSDHLIGLLLKIGRLVVFRRIALKTANDSTDTHSHNRPHGSAFVAFGSNP